MNKFVCVYGASLNTADKIYYEQARELGRLLAQAGYSLVFGAGDTGVMGAVVRGTRDGGGRAVGVLPRFMDKPGVAYGKCDELIITETLRERKLIMEQRAQAFIAAPGGIGTLEEFFEIITLKQLGQHKKPVIVLNTNGYYDHLTAMVEHVIKTGFMRERGQDLFEVADAPRGVVDILEKSI